MLLLRVSPSNLTSLWPTIITELVSDKRILLVCLYCKYLFPGMDYVFVYKYALQRQGTLFVNLLTAKQCKVNKLFSNQMTERFTAQMAWWYERPPREL